MESMKSPSFTTALLFFPFVLFLPTISQSRLPTAALRAGYCNVSEWLTSLNVFSGRKPGLFVLKKNVEIRLERFGLKLLTIVL